jgi:type IV pilus assembly protein PilO
MSARVKLILAGVVALLVCVVFYFFFVRPRSQELERTNNEIDAADAQTSSLQAQLADLRSLQEEEPRLRAELREIRELVPTSDETANFVFQLQDTATAAGVPFIRIDPEEPRLAVEDATLAQVRTTIGAQGGYFSLQDFVRRVGELDRAVSIDSFQMTSVEGEEAEERGRIQLQMVVRVFFEVPEVQAPVTTPGEAPATTETPAPGETPAAAPGGGNGENNNGNASAPAEQAG